jgi:hypothetical protein
MSTRAIHAVTAPARLEVGVMHASETMLFAAAEFAKYLRLMAEAPTDIRVGVVATPKAGGIALRLYDADERGALGAGVDPRLDDAIRIEVRDGAGVISGLNERSVLIAVYRFLHELGCRFVRPGADGEWIPRRDLARASVSLGDRPAYRHRAICIEGAVSLEHTLAIIDWAPKVGHSGFFMQFTDGFTFFDRYYARKGLAAEGESFSTDGARAWTIRAEEELRRRGLVYHAVGHGWTTMALGARLSHWDPVALPNMAEIKPLLAEVKGERALQWDRPMITSLCFSNNEARRRMVAVVVEHAAAHPEIDLLHVWIDDGGGNKCECESCRTHLPADLYVLLLGELQRALEARAIATRVVFLGYSDLLWPPRTGAHGLDQKRFVFMYANSRDSYARAMKPLPPAESPLPPFALNQNRLTQSAGEFQAFLRGWQQAFSGDSFIYEYHPLGSLLVNQHQLAHVLNEDARQLRALGLNGLVSCQSLRAFFPTGVDCWVLARSLWRPEQDPTDLMDDYFAAACGADATLAKEFLKVSSEELAKAADLDGAFGAKPGSAGALARLDTLCAEFAKVVERNLGERDPCRARSWRHLRWHLRILGRLSRLFRLTTGVAAGDPRAEWAEFKGWLADHEAHFGDALDVWGLAAGIEGRIVNGRWSTDPAAVMER